MKKKRNAVILMKKHNNYGKNVMVGTSEIVIICLRVCFVCNYNQLSRCQRKHCQSIALRIFMYWGGGGLINSNFLINVTIKKLQDLSHIEFIKNKTDIKA